MNAFIERVDADSIALDKRTKRHRQLLDDNLRWQRKAQEMAGHHEQRIDDLETLGTKGNIPSGYIVSSLWVLKQFARLIPRG